MNLLLGRTSRHYWRTFGWFCCCLTDERKYTRTDSWPFASLHNYIITYLGWSLAWWFWLLAVILLLFSSVFPSDWRLKDFLSCLLISDAIEIFPDERLCDFNHDIEYHLLAVGVHFSSFWLPWGTAQGNERTSPRGTFSRTGKKDIVLDYTLMASHLCLLPCRVLIRDDWILKNHIDETISTSIASGLIVFP